ncbi:MAG: hypothetical protein Q8R00_02505 [Candidatus Nanoarchaeia archaeon]|nr:hypothetical protein [Candidatus Nanoarchaeia archaeon]
MRAFVQCITGLLFIIAATYVLVTYETFMQSFITLIQAGIVAGILGLGFILIFLGILELKG